MTTKNTDTEKKWREDFELLNTGLTELGLKRNDDNTYYASLTQMGWKNYLAARRKAQEEIEILKFERVPVEIFNESEEKRKYFKQKHHDFADQCNDWKIRYDNDIQSRDAEIVKLKKFCSEFVYGEENPEYYSTMDEKIEKRDKLLDNSEALLRSFKNLVNNEPKIKLNSETFGIIKKIEQWIKQYEEMKK